MYFVHDFFAFSVRACSVCASLFTCASAKVALVTRATSEPTMYPPTAPKAGVNGHACGVT